MALLSGLSKHLLQFDIHVYTWHGGFSCCAWITNTEATGVLFLTACTCKPFYGRAYCISLSASYNFVSFTHRDKWALPLCICEICVLRYRYEWPGGLLFVCTRGQTWTLNFACVSHHPLIMSCVWPVSSAEYSVIAWDFIAHLWNWFL